MTNYFAIPAEIQRGQEVGMYAACIGGLANTVGQHQAAEFIFNTQIYTPAPVTSPMVDPNASVFSQPTASNNVGDLNNITSSTTGQDANAAQQNTSGTTTTQTVTSPDGTTTTTTTTTIPGGQTPATGTQTPGTGTQAPATGTGNAQFDQFMQSFNAFLKTMMEAMQKMLGTKVGETEEGEETSELNEGNKETKAAERQEEVDKIANKATSKKKFGNLMKDLEHINGKGPNAWYLLSIAGGIISGAVSRAKVDKALNTIASMPKEEYAAFKQYYEEQTGEDLAEVLTSKEDKRGVSSKTLDKVLEKDDEAMEWLSGEDSKKEEEIEEKE